MADLPIVIPPYVQYQAPLVPLRGNWNIAPPEGDRFITCEIDWGSMGGPDNCVQVQLTSNSPVQFSQIAAINVDNSLCGSDVQFLFPDSGALLVVPAYNQGLYPCFTNALQFFVTAPAAGSGSGSADRTIFQVLNSLPPGFIAIQPIQLQTSTSAQSVSLGANSTQPLIAPPSDGTLTGFNIVATGTATGSPSTATIKLEDGTGRVLWAGSVTFEANQSASVPIAITGLRQRFYDGLYLVIGAATTTGATASVNVYYTVP